MDGVDFYPVQFRRTGLPATCGDVPDIFRVTKSRTLIGRNRDDVDFFIFSSIHKKLISRIHCELIIQYKERNNNPTYCLVDRSTNGTFVNDVKVPGSVFLKHGDKVIFGHLQGVLIQPGMYSRQLESEFQFQFEEVGESESLPSTPPRDANSILSITWNSNSISPLNMLGRTIKGNGTPTEKENSFPSIDTTDSIEIDSLQTSNSETPIINGFLKTDARPRQIFSAETPGHVPAPQIISTEHTALSMISHPKTPGRDSGVFDNDIFDSDPGDDEELLSLAAKITEDFERCDSEEDIFNTVPIITPSRPGSLSPVLHPLTWRSTTPQEIGVNQKKTNTQRKPATGGKRRRGRPAAKSKRKATPYQKKKAAAAVEKIETQWETCDFYACQKPQEDTVAWVQCDDCDGWYHVDCMGCTYDAVKDSRTAFHCGCM